MSSIFVCCCSNTDQKIVSPLPKAAWKTVLRPVSPVLPLMLSKTAVLGTQVSVMTLYTLDWTFLVY